MKKIMITMAAIVAAAAAFANDGVFYANGAQLLPVSETDISVSKEVLNVKKVADKVEVMVYYEFFNPGPEKTLLVGFEAPSPYAGDMYSELIPAQLYKADPYIRNFSVMINDQWLEYKIAHVPNELFHQRDYYNNGKIKDMSQKEFDSLISSEENGWDCELPFSYVYHFNATFKKGVNKVVHTYSFDASMSVDQVFYFSYILTAANRWANNGIDDFTLRIQMEDTDDFTLCGGFFSNASEWEYSGTMVKGQYDGQYDVKLKNPTMIFRKKHFHPVDELTIYKYRDMGNYELYDSTPGEWAIASIDKLSDSYLWGMSKEDLRLMRNEIYARHGYVFQSQDLKAHFSKQPWYKPNPSFNINTGLTEVEKYNINVINEIEKLFGYSK